jgi:hypothetical protein
MCEKQYQTNWKDLDSIQAVAHPISTDTSFSIDLSYGIHKDLGALLGM